MCARYSSAFTAITSIVWSSNVRPSHDKTVWCYPGHEYEALQFGPDEAGGIAVRSGQVEVHEIHPQIVRRFHIIMGSRLVQIYETTR